MPVAERLMSPGAGLSGQIAYRLQRDILERRIHLGEHLTQDELCERFGVSRTPVREALLTLAGSSLVELRPNRGAVVRVPERREVQEIYELRAELEGYAAERAARRIDRVWLDRLDRSQAELNEVLTRGFDGGADLAALAAAIGAANDGFHDLILEVADQGVLAEDVRRLRARFPKDYVTEAASSANELRTLNIEDHGAIRAALADGDGSGARRAMADHINRARLLLIEHLERERFWG